MRSGQVLGYVCALEEPALAAPQMTAPRLAQAQALDFESPLDFELRRHQVTAEAHVPAAQLLAVLEDGVLGGRAVQLDQHRPDAATVHGTVLRGIKPVHVTHMGRARPADAGPRPVLVQLDCATAKHAVLKHSKELRSRHVHLCDHLTPAQIKTKRSLDGECLRLRGAGSVHSGMASASSTRAPTKASTCPACHGQHDRRRLTLCTGAMDSDAGALSHSPHSRSRPDLMVASQAAQA
jgi:hypothetical protein